MAHKFHHNFDDTLTPMCNSHDGIEDTEHFLLHCQQFNTTRNDLLQKFSQLLSRNISTFGNATLLNLLIYGDNSFSSSINNQGVPSRSEFRESDHTIMPPTMERDKAQVRQGAT